MYCLIIFLILKIFKVYPLIYFEYNRINLMRNFDNISKIRFNIPFKPNIDNICQKRAVIFMFP